jgi:hypothetical protein
MKSRLLGLIAAALLFIVPPVARAATYNIDLNTATGIPGTGGTAGLEGPCYCTFEITYSAIYSVNPGSTVDFGTVTTRSFGPIIEPDAGPFQDSNYLLGGVGFGFNPPVVLPTLTFYPLGVTSINGTPIPPFYMSRCTYNDTACIIAQASNTLTSDLIYLIPPGDTSIQLAWLGPYDYDPPQAPTPDTLTLFATGLAALGLFGWHRKRSRLS